MWRHISNREQGGQEQQAGDEGGYPEGVVSRRPHELLDRHRGAAASLVHRVPQQVFVLGAPQHQVPAAVPDDDGDADPPETRHSPAAAFAVRHTGT